MSFNLSLKLPISSLIALLLLTACNTTTSSKISYEDANQINVIKQYQASGRIALSIPENNHQLSFNWVQKDKASDMRISGPLGQGQIKAHIEPNLIKATIEGKEYVSDNPDELFKQITQVDWPILGISSWLAGQPHDAAAAKIIKNSQTTTQIAEDGWTVDYQEWQVVGAGLLPKVIMLKRGDVQAKILISSWKI